MFELDGGSLSPEDRRRIRTALEAEAARIGTIAVNMDIRDLELRDDN
jgi:hypothetical protein